MSVERILDEKTLAHELEGSIATATVMHNPVNRKVYLASMKNGGLRNAALVDISNISAIKAIVVLEEVLGFGRTFYTLRNICRVVSTPELTLDFDVGTAVTGASKVKAAVEPDFATITDITKTNIDLNGWKQVVKIAVSDEAGRQARHNLLALYTEDAGKELSKLENDLIKTEVETATAIAGANWKALSGAPPQSTNNPWDDISAALDAVWANGYRPDFIAMNPLVWAAFIGNTFVKEYVLTGQVQVGPDGNMFHMPGYPQVTVYLDYALTNTIALVGSKFANSVILAEGPTEAVQYRNELAGYTAYLIRQWAQPKIAVSGAVRKLTGVRA